MLRPHSTTAWQPPTGRANATSSGRWSSEWRWPEMTSISCFGLIRTLAIATPKKKVCNFVGGVASPVLANLALDGLERRLKEHCPTPHAETADRRKVHMGRYAD